MAHSKEFLDLVNEARSRIRELNVAEALTMIKNGAVLIDVREDSEFFEHAENAIHLGRGVIERDIVSEYPDSETELLLYCGGGYRSALAADSLQKMGYTNVYSIAGGWDAWKVAQAPTVLEIPF